MHQADRLNWPFWVPRTDADKRINGRFSTKTVRGIQEKISAAQARKRIIVELDSFTKYGKNYRCDPASIIISSNLIVNRDGYPISKQKRIDDPGIAVYFVLDDVDRCIPCDMYLRAEDNMAAIAATIEALRTIERHGSQMFEAAFSGFDALPDLSKGEACRDWRAVLNYTGFDYNDAINAYMVARKAAHPDHGGTNEKFIAVQTAWEEAKIYFGKN